MERRSWFASSCVSSFAPDAPSTCPSQTPGSSYIADSSCGRILPPEPIAHRPRCRIQNQTAHRPRCRTRKLETLADHTPGPVVDVVDWPHKSMQSWLLLNQTANRPRCRTRTLEALADHTPGLVADVVDWSYESKQFLQLLEETARHPRRCRTRTLEALADRTRCRRKCANLRQPRSSTDQSKSSIRRA